MVPMVDLWLPLVLSAVLAFVASSIFHMVLPLHKKDYAKLPGQDKLMEAMRAEGVAPGNYYLPHAASMKEMGSPEMIKKFEQGPVGMINVIPSGPPAMGKSLTQWFVFCLAIGVVTAYLTGRTLAPGEHYLQVFRVAGTVAFLGYAGAEPLASIWKGQKWGSTARHMFDGLVYALLTAGCFGWLWPQA